MQIPVLSRIFAPQRFTSRAGLPTPLVYETPVEEVGAPFVVSGARTPFLHTSRRPPGVLHAGFTSVDLTEESSKFGQLYTALQAIGSALGWNNTHSSIDAGTRLMLDCAVTPVACVLSKELCAHRFPEEASRLALADGLTHEDAGMTWMIGTSLRPGTALLFASPDCVGTYTRCRDALALTIHRADRTVILIDTERAHGVAGEARSTRT